VVTTDGSQLRRRAASLRRGISSASRRGSPGRVMRPRGPRRGGRVCVHAPQFGVDEPFWAGRRATIGWAGLFGCPVLSWVLGGYRRGIGASDRKVGVLKGFRRGAVLLVAAGVVAGLVASAAGAASSRVMTLHLVEKDSSFHFVDNPPLGQKRGP